jgi:UDP-N-acetylmuramyl pentapeptide phosphotransferase/UDP-N-acetylglucosamine-1-phosphate transferase
MAYFLNFFVGFIVTALLTPPVIVLAKRYKILDDPTLHRHPGIIHKKPIPRAGGLALFLGAFITSLRTILLIT